MNDRANAVGVLRLRQSGTLFSSVCGCSARSAEQPHTQRSARTMLPQAKRGIVTQNDATA